MYQLNKEMRMTDWHQGLADVNFSDDYKLKLTSKKLNSGKCQVKFYATLRGQKDMYGYVLVESDQKLKEVVSSIKSKLTTIHLTNDFHHIHLYSIGKPVKQSMNFLVFDC